MVLETVASHQRGKGVSAIYNKSQYSHSYHSTGHTIEGHTRGKKVFINFTQNFSFISYENTTKKI
jgi:hypothetical protein